MKIYVLSDRFKYPTLEELPRETTIVFDTQWYFSTIQLDAYIYTLGIRGNWTVKHQQCWYKGSWDHRCIIHFTKRSDAIKFKLCLDVQKLKSFGYW